MHSPIYYKISRLHKIKVLYTRWPENEHKYEISSDNKIHKAFIQFYLMYNINHHLLHYNIVHTCQNAAIIEKGCNQGCSHSNGTILSEQFGAGGGLKTISINNLTELRCPPYSPSTTQ